MSTLLDVMVFAIPRHKGWLNWRQSNIKDCNPIYRVARSTTELSSQFFYLKEEIFERPKPKLFILYSGDGQVTTLKPWFHVKIKLF